MIEKYNNLAREALSSGDKILSENYFQHADHFTRILKEKEIQKKTNLIDKDSSEDKSSIETITKKTVWSKLVQANNFFRLKYI